MTALTSLGLTSAPLLKAIQAATFTNLADLAEQAGRSKANITRDLGILEDAGLITRPVKTKPELTSAALDQLAAVDRANAAQPLHDQIERDPFNPRQDFDEEFIRGLAESIYDGGKLTLLQPLVIRPREGGDKPYRLVAGEQRHRAIGLLIADGRWPADLPPPSTIRRLTDEEAEVLALIENVQRQNLNAIDEAMRYKHFRDVRGWSTARIAEAANRSQKHVQNLLRCLELPEDVQARMRLPKGDERHIGAREARSLFQVSKEPTRPKAPELSVDLALALLELADKIERAPMSIGEPGFTNLSTRPRFGALATLNERKIIVLREWAGQVFAKIQLYSSGAITWLEDVGFYGQDREAVIDQARRAVAPIDRVEALTADGRYLTAELNTELAPEEPEEPEEAEQSDEYHRPNNRGIEIPAATPPQQIASDPELPAHQRFSQAVVEAALDAEAKEQGGRRYVAAKVSGSTTLEGETWPDTPIEVLRTPWKGAPGVEIRLTTSSSGRWHACLSTQQGSPGYAGQGDAFGVWTSDPLFANRTDALRYAVARINKQLGAWAEKKALRTWIAELFSAPISPMANPVRQPASERPSFAHDLGAVAVRSLLDQRLEAVMTLVSSEDGRPTVIPLANEEDGRRIYPALGESGLWSEVTIHDRDGKLLVAWG